MEFRLLDDGKGSQLDIVLVRGKGLDSRQPSRKLFLHTIQLLGERGIGMEESIKQWCDFISKTLGREIKPLEYAVDHQHSHRYRPGKWHIYSFWLREVDQALKIGVAGPNSAARYSSHHYNPGSSNSNLAKSISGDGTCIELPKDWLLKNTYRINVVFEDFSKPMAHALEAHLHLMHSPKYEK